MGLWHDILYIFIPQNRGGERLFLSRVFCARGHEVGYLRPHTVLDAFTINLSLYSKGLQSRLAASESSDPAQRPIVRVVKLVKVRDHRAGATRSRVPTVVILISTMHLHQRLVPRTMRTCVASTFSTTEGFSLTPIVTSTRC